MSPIYVPGKVVLRKTWQPMDPDAAAYITAVEAADTAAGQSGGLEEKTKIAIDNFVLGCKADGIWSAIKASCILAGARTRQGAFVRLVGTAPTPFNFVDADYNRKTGLKGNGSTTYLDTNRAGNADPQNSAHYGVYVSTPTTAGGASPNWFPAYIASVAGVVGGSRLIGRLANNGNLFIRNTNSTLAEPANSGSLTGFIGTNRSNSSDFTIRLNGSGLTYGLASETPNSNKYVVHAAYSSDGTINSSSYSNGRIAFYSIGESLALNLLDARVTDLITAIGAAIP